MADAETLRPAEPGCDRRAGRTRGVKRGAAGSRQASSTPDQDLRRFKAALANAPVILFQQDLSLRYTWIHLPKAGFDAQSVLGRTDADLSGAEHARPLDAVKRRAIETAASARQEVTMQGLPASGRFDLYVEPQRNEAGEVVGVTCAAIGIAHDREGAGSPQKPHRALGGRDALLQRISARNDAIGGGELFPICTDVLRRKLAGHGVLGRRDRALLGLLERRRRFVPARQRLKLEPGERGRPWLIGSGWVYSYKTLSSGERQVMGFHLPGDLIGSGGRGGEDTGRAYGAITDCVLCEFDRGLLTTLRRSETMLPDALQWSDAREEAILQQHLISIGRRSALARVAHLLLELGARLKLVGLADDSGYGCPLSQELIGDALGLTKIHVNRMLRELREGGCMTFRSGRVSIADFSKAAALAEYDAAYLDVPASAPPEPRIAGA